MPDVVGEYLDRIATVEMRPGSGNLPRGVIHRLYAAARDRAGEPLVLGMARALQERVSEGDNVVILTGAGAGPHLPNSEVDGILGAVAIARALHYGLSANVTIVTEERAFAPVEAATRSASMNFRRSGEPESANSITFEASPIDREDCANHAKRLLGTLRPSAMIGIEKLAPNKVGVIHGATGLSYDDSHTKPDVYFGLAAEAGILTCGIGDGGNEVGFGIIRSCVEETMPAGAICECPCGQGTASDVSTDRFVVAAISDWGGYAVNAMLSYLTGAYGALIRPSEVERMILATVNAGAFDGATARPTLSDDGVPLESQVAYVTILQQLVELASSGLSSPGH